MMWKKKKSGLGLGLGLGISIKTRKQELWLWRLGSWMEFVHFAHGGRMVGWGTSSI